jgi:hypothetical protein
VTIRTFKAIAVAILARAAAATPHQIARTARFLSRKAACSRPRSPLAGLAYDRKLFAAATRLSAEALAADPKLGDDPQARHRSRNNQEMFANVERSA